MKKPRMKKLPKKPKQKAAPHVWERWAERCKPILEHNEKAMRLYKSVTSKISSIAKSIDSRKSKLAAL